jgi:peptide/nickel transport system substrate-binding protein
VTFSPLNPYFSREASQRYAAFRPDLARKLLDDNGYVDSDGDGYRELKDGSRFEFTIDINSSRDGTDVCDLVADYWREIGIRAHMNVALRDIIWPRRVTGEFDVHYWYQAGTDDPLDRSYHWASTSPTFPFWHRNASREGPSWLKEATDTMNKALYTRDPEQLRSHMNRLTDLYSENVPFVAVGYLYNIWGSNKRLGNVPHDLRPASEYGGWSRGVFHEQLFIRRGSTAFESR